MDIPAGSLPWQSLYKILIGSVLPRPIGWISSVDAAGRPNLAPFSFFTAVCANPPTLLFCPMVRSSGAVSAATPKDTLRNVRATGEFVVNIVSEALVDAVNITSTDLPADVNEFELAGLEALPSVVVRSPRVAQSPIQFECRVTHIHDIGASPGAGSVVIGEIVYLHIRDDVLIGNDKIDLAHLKPIARLSGNGYARVTDTFDLPRPPSQIK